VGGVTGMDEPVKRHILVIDDSRPICQYLMRSLEKKGYAVHLAYDGDDGVRQAMELLPDLILLDKELPGTHGFAVSRILRRYRETSFIPILMISADTDSNERILGLEMGADDFISKRIETEELDSKIRAFMRIKDLQDRVLSERDKLGQVFKFIHEPIAICNREDKVVLASQMFLSLFQMPREIAEFRTFTEILRTLAVPAEEIVQLRQAGRAERRFAIRIGQETKMLTAMAAPLKLAEDDQGVAYIFKDITQQIADERLKASFHSMIAHDLRSPLSVIQGYVTLLSDGRTGDLNETQLEFLRSIANKVGEITTLLNDFLDVNKMDAGFVSLNRCAMPLEAAVREVIADLSLLAGGRGITITTDLPPQALVDGDPLRVKQILLNLTSNAIKYNVDGGWVRLAARPRDDGRIAVTVSDGGVGLTSDELAGLFQPYRRAGSTERRIRGVGLGLVIVKKLVEAHGGAVSVTSRPGEGSAFTFSLALGDPSAVASPPAETPVH